VKGRVFRIARFSVHDGPGIRTTVFLKGCPLRCAWCHSPESQRPEPQLAIHQDRCVACGTCLPACGQHAITSRDGVMATDRGRCRVCGACADACPEGAREVVGREWDSDELLATLARDEVFFDESGGGVTFSGGEPLMQPAFLAEMLRGCGARGIHAAVDTCGMADRSAVDEVAELADLFLFDVKAAHEGRHRAITGASNAAILDNLRRLVSLGATVRPRFPCVPGLTADDENVRQVGQLLADLGLRTVDVLPFHRAGTAKFARLGIEDPAPDLRVPSKDEVARVIRQLEGLGLQVHVGG
jgi:pyruvate formate lyase activating enzyme